MSTTGAPLPGARTRDSSRTRTRRGIAPRETFDDLLLAAEELLDGIRSAMIGEGLDDEAESLETTVADLEWQRAELDGG